MKKLFVSQSLAEIESLKELLEGAGIACTVKNQQGSSLAGSVPFAEVFPELWVINDQDFERAKEFLAEQAETAIAGPAWICAGCGESHAGEFVSCWKCGKAKDSDGSQGSVIDSETPLPVGSPGAGVFVGICLGIAATMITYWLWSYVSVTGTAYDRNADGKDDVRYEYSGRELKRAKFDDNFDGYFETSATYNQHGDFTRIQIDRDGDGKPDAIVYYSLGRPDIMELLDRNTNRVKKRMYYKLDVKVREEIDEDGDGKFERVIEFDEFENPK